MLYCNRSHIWKTITFVGDFNTQLLALNVFARILNCFDIGRREDELKTIKWTNLKLFKDNLVKVIETSNQRLTFENVSIKYFVLYNNYLYVILLGLSRFIK